MAERAEYRALTKKNLVKLREHQKNLLYQILGKDGGGLLGNKGKRAEDSEAKAKRMENAVKKRKMR